MNDNRVELLQESLLGLGYEVKDDLAEVFVDILAQAQQLAYDATVRERLVFEMASSLMDSSEVSSAPFGPTMRTLLEAVDEAIETAGNLADQELNS